MEDGMDSRGRVEPILQTKLHRPQSVADWVRRDRLLKLMTRANEVPLTLVAAPAGYGKSVLVAQWAEQLEHPVAWLSMDAADNELRAFLQYFLAAVDTVSPGACDVTRELVEAGSLAPATVLAGYLLNDLATVDGPCFVVLDDYHRVATLSPVHDLVTRVLEHPPPQLHLVIATRRDPPFNLASLRAANFINDVRIRDLRFTGPETVEFLGAAVDLSVSDETLAHLEQQVEGWAAGLRLVSLAARHVGNADAFLKGLPGRLPEIQEYLVGEVLDAQVDEVGECMLTSSVLDRFCADLLDAVCEAPGASHETGLTGAGFLEELRKGNLFTISLDERHQWFRYHHLFQELLVRELGRRRGPDHAAGLHLRACRWFEDEGLIDEAVQHAVAAEDMGRAVQLVIRHRHAALDDSQWYVLDRWLDLVSTGAGPPQAEILMGRAWISLNYHYRVEAVPPLLAEVESLIGDEPGREQVRSELAVCRGYVFWLMGNGAESLQLLDAGLEAIPAAHVDFRSNAELVFAQAKQMVGRKEEALRFLDDLLAPSKSVGAMREARLLIARVFIHVVAGDLIGAELANRRMWQLVERESSAYVRIWTGYMQGVIHLQRCEWEAAVEHLERSVANRFIHHARAAVDSMIGLMIACQALGRQEEAEAALETLSEYVATLGDPAMESLAVSAQVRLAVLQGRSEAARGWVEALESSPDGALLWWIDVPSITRCQATIALGLSGGLAKAEARLREHREAADAQHNTSQLIRVLTLLAMAYERQGRWEEAVGSLERAVTLARKGTLLLPFVELGAPMVALLNQLAGESEFAALIERLVEAASAAAAGSTARENETRIEGTRAEGDGARSAAAAGNLEGLTNRELDVLELLAVRLQDKEIADRLGISFQTVNSHLKQVYQKLGAHGRREAVERAMARGVLDRPPWG